MALSKLSGDEAGIVFVHLCNALEPRDAVYFSSVSHELRAATQEGWQQLRADHEAAAAWCRKMGMRSCRELSEAWRIGWLQRFTSAADLSTLAKLGSVLPALEELRLQEITGSANPDGMQRLAEGLVAGSLPAVTCLDIGFMHVGDAGASAIAAALDRGALPRLNSLLLSNAAIGDAALAALAPALRRRPALVALFFRGSSFGDEGLAALVAPPPPAGTPPPPAGGLKKLEALELSETQITDAGCATLVAALDSGALPALKKLELAGTPASAAAQEAVRAALDRSRGRGGGALS